ncbi:MAG: hypothetical protein AAFX85_14325, partial [Pseudomonadota bacterium]
MTLLPALLLLALAAPDALAGEAARVHLSPSQTDESYWQVVYSFDAPTRELAFCRPSGSYRRDRLVLPEGFLLVTQGGTDRLRRQDGEAYREVTLFEPTTIENPPVGYLPFAHFGDGGLLLYTGRYHAHAGACQQEEGNHNGPYQITIDPGDAGTVLWQGQRSPGAVTLRDTGDGNKVYVGTATVLEGELYVAVIDATMPELVVSALAEGLPRLLAYFAERLPADVPALTLFASYHVPGNLPGIS